MKLLKIFPFIILLLVAAPCSNMLDEYDPSNLAEKDTSLRASFTIANNAEIIYRRKTTLNITCRNADEMRFKDDTGDWTEWEGVAETKEWVLPGGHKQRIVRGEFRNITTNELVDASDDVLMLERLTASNGHLHDGYGESAAVSSDGLIIAVGAPYEDGNFTGNYMGDNWDQGAVYVYRWIDNEWEEAYLKISEGAAGDNFGCSVAMSSDGTRLAAGARNADSGTGAVYIYTNNSGVWSRASIYNALGSSSDLFGEKVELSSDGNTVVIGSPGVTSNTGTVFVSEYNSGTGLWSGLSELPSPVIIPGDKFGGSVSISGNGITIAAGARYHDSGGFTEQGTVWLYSYGASWTLAQTLSPADANLNNYDFFGCSTALNSGGSVLAAGSLGYNNQTGCMYVFESASGWSQTHKLEFSTGENTDRFGSDICISSDSAMIIAGALQDDRNGISNQGSAFLYSGTGYAVEQELYALDGRKDDRFGYSVAVSDDNTRIIVSSVKDPASSTATEMDCVYIFRTDE